MSKPTRTHVSKRSCELRQESFINTSGVFISSVRSSYSDDGLLYIYIYMYIYIRPLRQILSIHAFL